MTISSRDGLIAAMASRQDLQWAKTVVLTTTAITWADMLHIAGNPGAGTLAGTSTTAGVVPDDTTPGFCPINAFGVGATGYIDRICYSSTLQGRIRLVDVLWKAGAYAFNANVSLSSQPSFAARVPNGDYSGLQLWMEAVTSFTGNLTLTITYTNQAGVTGKSTVFATGAAPIVARMIQIPLAAGDTGIQKVESVIASVSSVGTFNLLILRQLWTTRVVNSGDGNIHGPERTGMPIVFDTSALMPIVCPDSTNSGLPELTIGIING